MRQSQCNNRSSFYSHVPYMNRQLDEDERMDEVDSNEGAIPITVRYDLITVRHQGKLRGDTPRPLQQKDE
jgi:hypothetical protein